MKIESIGIQRHRITHGEKVYRISRVTIQDDALWIYSLVGEIDSGGADFTLEFETFSKAIEFVEEEACSFCGEADNSLGKHGPGYCTS